ncbi:hypothetical protein FXO38_03714 [Capsicum annuum]|nr:hypothetical protein FXO38_03714 [Capsicum annuum]KAF3679964.1 hypothetical protein FXO37_03584 [Capsicum annuum]
MNGIVALHSSPMQKDAAEKNGALFRFVGCVGSRITRALVDTGREQAKRVIRNGKKDTTTLPLCWNAGTNTVMKQQASVYRTDKNEMVVARRPKRVSIELDRAKEGPVKSFRQRLIFLFISHNLLQHFQFAIEELLPASVAIAAKLTEEGGGNLTHFHRLNESISVCHEFVLSTTLSGLVQVIVFTYGWRLDIQREWVIHRAGTLVTTVRPTPASILVECATDSFHGKTYIHSGEPVLSCSNVCDPIHWYERTNPLITKGKSNLHIAGPENLHLGACLVPGETVDFDKARGPRLLCL